MPFKSKAQSRLFFAKARRGEIPLSTAKEWAGHTNYSKLPERKKQSTITMLLEPQSATPPEPRTSTIRMLLSPGRRQ